MEVRKAKLIANKAGGNSSKGSFNYKVSIPNIWVKDLGLGPENRDICIYFENDKIIIKKDDKEGDNMIYELGKKYDDLKGPEGIKADFTDTGMVLSIKYNKPTLKEVNNIKSGEFNFKTIIIDNIIFFLFKFGNEQWMDAPYTPHLSKHLSKLEQLEDGKGYSLSVILSDATTGEAQALRLLGLDTKTSKAIKHLIETQINEDFDINEYDKKLKRIYRTYTTDDMVNISSNI